ncbi:MAG: undecaprenyldiphospho-muramoylpentapeptide beta-N-acetylglucosaminyltransferase [Methyloglobulus sp.]|nr:undecaprenyldiphospho-muramoylpentapeptide beta-N-acetylglucosaminyltransferase [Methyloglobulus sp.]
MGKRIVIMAGGTGGHVFPALAVAQWLIENGWQVSWLGTHKGLESKVVPENGIEIDWLSVTGVRGKGVLSKVTSGFKLIQACGQALAILRRRKPDVVLGMGGFVAGPGGLMARILRIPLVIHEQNRVAGTTNRLLGKIANQVLEAFPNSFKKEFNAKCTGNPLRKQFQNLPEAKAKPNQHSLRLLVIGGSQGAQVLNEVIPDALVNMKALEVRHQTGTAMQEQVAKRYQELGVRAEATAFIQDMVSAYQWADIIICRAGAMTVSEVAAMGLPAILVPLPNAIDEHQMANARYLSDAGAGLILPQKDLNTKNLIALITKAQQQLDVMTKAAKQCARMDATAVVAQFCISEASR